MQKLKHLRGGSTYISKAGMKRTVKRMPNTELVENKFGTLPTKTHKISKRLSKLGIRYDRSNDNVALYVNSSWTVTHKELLMTGEIMKTIGWGIDDEMGAVLLKLKPGQVLAGKSEIDTLSEPLRKKLREHHISWQDF